MKHTFSTTALLIFLFVAAQIIGLSLVAMSQDVHVTEQGQDVSYGPTALGARPETEGGTSLLMIAIGVGIGTMLALLLIKLGAKLAWKIWFFVATWIGLSIALGVLIPGTIAVTLAVALAVWKVFRPNPVIHNLTEILVYGGIAVLLVPLFDIVWVVALLVLISIYDWIAVHRTGHMVTLAKGQADSNVFAGIAVPTGSTSAKPLKTTEQFAKTTTVSKKSTTKSMKKETGTIGGTAILGGGDIAFPLVFAGVVLQWLIEARNMAPTRALFATLIIPLGATVALAWLFAIAKKGKFYPAMPPITLGCLIGFGIIALIF